MPGDGIHDGDGLARFPAGRTGRADIVLPSEKHVSPTLLLIEVKLHARSTPLDYNPVIQVDDYNWALSRQVPRRWRIRRWTIAREIPHAIRDQARRERIACSLCGEEGRIVRTAVGIAPV